MSAVHFRSAGRIERPWFVWLAVPLELITALGALPVGWSLLTDPTGAGVGLPSESIANSVFQTYFVPGLYLFFVNGIAMLVTAGLTLVRHWSAPLLTFSLGTGLIVWILVQLLVMPETSWLQWFFVASGGALGAIGLLWLRRTSLMI